MLLFIPVFDPTKLSAKQKKIIKRNVKIASIIFIGFGMLLIADAYINGTSPFYIAGIFSVVFGVLLFFTVSKSPNFK